MNLFIVGWNLARQQQSMALAELRQMIEVYPQLEPGNAWDYSSPCGTIFLASMHTADHASAPRQYVAQNVNEVVLYSGLPVSVSGTFEAHKAGELASHWPELTEDLEGPYVVVRAGMEPVAVELQTDFLGMEQVYHCGDRESWLVSNSVQLIERVGGLRTLDPLGVSLFLSVGWAGADRTLRRDVKTITGGQRWVWWKGHNAPKQEYYYSPSRLANRRPQRLTRGYVERLAENLMGLCRTQSQSFGTMTCPLTAGRDSRLLAALLMRAGLHAKYYTAGSPSSVDVRIASQIANAFKLDHRIEHIDTTDVVKEWDVLAWKYVRQNDGLSSLFQIADSLKMNSEVARLELSLWGIGGEIGRGFYGKPQLYLSGPGSAAIQRHMGQRLVRDYGGLIRREVIGMSRDYLNRFVLNCVDLGFRPLDVPDVFYAYQRVGRWGGSNARRAMPVCDLFSPFCTRSFAEAAFSLSPCQRYTEPLHYQLLALLNAELHRLPFGKEGWRSQHPVMNALLLYGGREARQLRNRIMSRVRKLRSRSEGVTNSGRSTLGYDRSSWLEAKRDRIREVCMDQSQNSLWDHIDRPQFERLMAAGTSSAERQIYGDGLYQIITLFYYEAEHQRQQWAQVRGQRGGP